MLARLTASFSTAIDSSFSIVWMARSPKILRIAWLNVSVPASSACSCEFQALSIGLSALSQSCAFFCSACC